MVLITRDIDDTASLRLETLMNFPFFFSFFFFEISRALYRSNDTVATRQSMLQPTSRESVQHERNLSRLRGNFVDFASLSLFFSPNSPLSPFSLLRTVVRDPFEKFYSYSRRSSEMQYNENSIEIPFFVHRFFLHLFPPFTRFLIRIISQV